MATPSSAEELPIADDKETFEPADVTDDAYSAEADVVADEAGIDDESLGVQELDPPAPSSSELRTHVSPLLRAALEPFAAIEDEEVAAVVAEEHFVMDSGIPPPQALRRSHSGGYHYYPGSESDLKHFVMAKLSSQSALIAPAAPLPAPSNPAYNYEMGCLTPELPPEQTDCDSEITNNVNDQPVNSSTSSLGTPSAGAHEYGTMQLSEEIAALNQKLETKIARSRQHPDTALHDLSRIYNDYPFSENLRVAKAPAKRRKAYKSTVLGKRTEHALPISNSHSHHTKSTGRRRRKSCTRRKFEQLSVFDPSRRKREPHSDHSSRYHNATAIDTALTMPPTRQQRTQQRSQSVTGLNVMTNGEQLHRSVALPPASRSFPVAAAPGLSVLSKPPGRSGPNCITPVPRQYRPARHAVPPPLRPLKANHIDSVNALKTAARQQVHLAADLQGTAYLDHQLAMGQLVMDAATGCQEEIDVATMQALGQLVLEGRPPVERSQIDEQPQIDELVVSFEEQMNKAVAASEFVMAGEWQVKLNQRKAQLGMA